MTPIRAEMMSTSAAERQASRLAELERRLSVLERRTVQGTQRAYAEELSEVTLSSPGAGITDLGGPEVTVNAEDGQIVFVAWEAEIRAGSTGQDAFVVLHEPTDYATTDVTQGIILGKQNYTSWLLGTSHARTTFYSGFYDSLGNNTVPVPMVAGFPATPGERTYSLRYAVLGDSSLARWRNRKLWVVVV